MWWKILLAVGLMAYVIFPDMFPIVIDDVAAFSGSILAAVTAFKQVSKSVDSVKEHIAHKKDDADEIDEADDLNDVEAN